MCIPNLTDKCCHYVNVPEGTLNLGSYRGKCSGLEEPGPRYCLCSCYGQCHNIPAQISRNTIRYAMQINSIPTKDNVLVSLEVGCSFHIGCSEETLEEDAKRFFYNFGPNRLEEYLQEELDESFRNFVKNIRVYRLRDSKTEMTY